MKRCLIDNKAKQLFTNFQGTGTTKITTIKEGKEVKMLAA